MLCRNVIGLHAVLAIAVVIQPLSAQQIRDVQPATPYRLIQAVSSNMAQQKIAAAAADGYRVITVVPTNSLQSAPVIPDETEDSGGSGVLILLKRTPERQAFEYRFVAVEDAKEFRKSLNLLGADGFRLVPSTLHLGWAEQRGMEMILDPEAASRHQQHRFDVPVALLEKTPGDTTKYSYQQVSRSNDIEKFAARGYFPVAGNVLWNFVILESTSAGATPNTKVQHARLAKFSAGADTHSEITHEVGNDAPGDEGTSAQAQTGSPDVDVKLNDASLYGKKLLLVNDGLAGFNLAPVIDVLTVSGAPETPKSYRLLFRNDVAALEKAVNESAAQGFRLFPTVATAFRKKTHLHGTRALGVIPMLEAQTSVELYRVMAVMYPAAPATTYRYRIMSPRSPAELLNSLTVAEVDGFHFVSLRRGILVLENVSRAGGQQ